MAEGSTVPYVRNWGVLIALVGVMLLYGAWRPSSRALVLTVASLSKLTFVGLVLAHGGRYLSGQAGVAVAIDSVWVLVFVSYLATGTRGPPPV